MLYIGPMSILTIYVCEDMAEHRENLKRLFSLLAEEYPMQTEFFHSAEQLSERLQNLREKNLFFPHLILLDIELPGMDGITLGRQIREMDKDVFLVFVTAYTEYAVKGYGIDAFRYLVKPISIVELRKLLTDIQKEYRKKKKISVKTRNGHRIIHLQDLIYICAEDKYTVLYTKEQHYISDFSLKIYEEQLKDYGFFRIHRKYLVNLYHHKGIKAGKVLLSGGHALYISKNRIVQYQEKIFQLLREDIL